MLSPKPGQVLAHNYVVVSYELTQPASAAGSPNFQVQLDSRDPITTTDRQLAFTGLTAGKHTVMIQVVDANGVAIPGLRVEVAFSVAGTTSSLATRPGIARNEVADAFCDRRRVACRRDYFCRANALSTSAQVRL